MIIVNNKHDLACAIVMDRLLAKTKRDHGVPCKHGLSDDEIRHMRQYMHRNTDFDTRSQAVSDDFRFVTCDTKYGCDVTTKCFKSEKYTAKEKREIEEDLWIHAMPSQYDCTGQEFTTRIKFFEVPNGTWIYHFTSFDY